MINRLREREESSEPSDHKVLGSGGSVPMYHLLSNHELLISRRKKSIWISMIFGNEIRGKSFVDEKGINDEIVGVRNNSEGK